MPCICQSWHCKHYGRQSSPRLQIRGRGTQHEFRGPTASALTFVKNLPDFFYRLANLPLFSGLTFFHVGQSTPTQPMCAAVISPILFKIGEWMKPNENNHSPKFKIFPITSFLVIVIQKHIFLNLPWRHFHPKNSFFVFLWTIKHQGWTAFFTTQNVIAISTNSHCC